VLAVSAQNNRLGMKNRITQLSGGNSPDRRTWLKLIAWAAAEGLALETLPSDRAGEFYKEATRRRSASHHHLQVKAALALLYDVVGYKSIRRVPGSQILARENRAALPHCLAIGTTPA
jgi:hypothetical protein